MNDEKEYIPDIKTQERDTSIKDIDREDIDIKEVEDQEIKEQEGIFENNDSESEITPPDTDPDEIMEEELYQLSSDEPISLQEKGADEIDLEYESKNTKGHIGKSIAKNVIAAPVTIAADTIRLAAKSVAAKANPLDRKINKSDTSDTGVESLRLAYDSLKKGSNAVKTVKGSIKTVENTVKTVHTTAKVGKTVIVKTADYGKKTLKGAYKVSKFIVTHIVAAVMNPFAAVMLAFLLLVATSIGSVVMLVASIGGVAGANATAMTTAAGLGEDEKTIAEKYKEGEAFFDKAVEDKRNGYNALIDSLRFTESDWAHNDLIYLELYLPGETAPYVWKSAFDRWNRGAYADPAWKNILKRDVWHMGVTYNEAAAIAYVYLQKEAGEEYTGDTASIHEVEFTQEVFDEIVNHCVEYSDSLMDHQGCPPDNCVIDGDRRYCKHEHTLHNVGVWVYDKEHVMEALGFTDTEKRWVELTEYGFEHNIHITGDDTSSEEVSE